MVSKFSTQLQPSHRRSTSDSSVSSTFSVDRDDKKSHFHNYHCCHTTKSVCFNLGLNEVYCNTVLCKKDTKSLWYTRDNLKQFRKDTRTTAKAIAHLESMNSTANSYKNVMKHTFELSLLADDITLDTFSTKEDQSHLTQWAGAEGRLGMEKLAIHTLAKDQAERRLDIVDMVLDYQDDLLLSKGTRDDEFIRESCERISRSSCVFANTFACALASSVRDENS